MYRLNKLDIMPAITQDRSQIFTNSTKVAVCILIQVSVKVINAVTKKLLKIVLNINEILEHV